MKNMKKGFTITNLKKYFPVAKTKWFQKEQLYVRANEDITIDIFSGETFGLVGESGCGKSTLGRTILQLSRHIQWPGHKLCTAASDNLRPFERNKIFNRMGSLPFKPSKRFF